MTDKIPSFKEEIDAIHVPMDKLDAIIANTVQGDMPKKRRSMRKKLYYSAATVVASFGLLIGSATVSPVMANIVSQIPLIGSIFSASGDRGLEQVGELGLTQAVGQSQTVDGSTITIDEVYYDGTRFTIGYSLESETTLGDVQLSPRFFVDGEPFGSMMQIELDDITPTLRTELVNINAPENGSTAFQLDVTIQSSDDKQWDFSIPVSTKTNTKLVTIDHQQEAGGFTLSAPDLKISPAGVLLTFNKTYLESEMNDFLSQYIDFKVVDEAGNELAFQTGDSFGETADGQMHWTGSQLYEPIDDHVKTLTITPYMTIPKSMKEMDEDGNEIEIDIKRYQDKGITFDSFTVEIP